MSGAKKDTLTRAAEHVREAQLAILKKAEGAVAPAKTRPETRAKEVANIQLERKKWVDMSVADLISQAQRDKTAS